MARLSAMAVFSPLYQELGGEFLAAPGGCGWNINNESWVDSRPEWTECLAFGDYVETGWSDRYRDGCSMGMLEGGCCSSGQIITVPEQLRAVRI